MHNRDIDSYQANYDQLPFEPTMADIRKRMIVAFLEKQGAKKIIEVGCGNASIFNEYQGFEQMIVVEPSKVFFDRATIDAAKFKEKKITLINQHFSDEIFEGHDLKGIDTLLISGLLHELPDPVIMLRNASRIVNSDTVLHINVPNAHSLHRIMAKEMGLMQDVKQKTELQQLLQQHHTFDIESLTSLAEEAGFTVIESGSYFIKPFSHKQMDVLQHHPLFGDNVIRGFEKLVSYLPGFGAEIYLNLRKQL